METTARRVDYIATHLRPHLDEIAAIWLLKRFGREKFPGVENASIAYHDSGAATPDGRSVEEWEKEGWLFVGCGGSRFDEHPSQDNGRKEGECAATLVAKELGVADDPALQKILQFVLNTDTKATNHPFDLGVVVQDLHATYPEDPHVVMDWVWLALDAKYAQQKAFFDAAEDFARAEFHEVILENGRTAKVMVVESDRETIWKYARWRDRDIAVGIVRREWGHTQIFTEKRFSIDLSRTAAFIRMVERARKGIETKREEMDAIAEEGVVLGIEEWYYFKVGEMLLNGSLTNISTPPTRVPLSEITQLVIRGISKKE